VCVSLLINSVGHIKLTDFGLSKIGLMNCTYTYALHYSCQSQYICTMPHSRPTGALPCRANDTSRHCSAPCERVVTARTLLIGAASDTSLYILTARVMGLVYQSRVISTVRVETGCYL